MRVMTTEVGTMTSLAGTVGDKGVVVAMRVGVMVRRVETTMGKVMRAMREVENTTTRDEPNDEGKRPRGRFWGL